MRRSRTPAIAAAAAVLAAASAPAVGFTYQVDDGGPNFGDAPAFGNGLVVLNAFTVQDGFDVVTSLDVATYTISTRVGLYTAAVWSDPNQDGNPSDAVLLGTSTVGMATSSPTFDTLALTNPVDVGVAGDIFFAGVFFDSDPEYMAVGVDSDYAGPTVAWLAEFDGAPADPNDLSGAVAESFAYTIRANAVPAPSVASVVALGGVCALRRRRIT